MTNPPGQPPRALVGRILLTGSFMLAAIAAAFWFRWLDVGEEQRPIFAGVLLVAAVADAFIAFRFLGEHE